MKNIYFFVLINIDLYAQIFRTARNSRHYVYWLLSYMHQEILHFNYQQDMDIELLQPKPDHFLFTSESVTSGHPDKLSDFISDSILDACLTIDPNAKVACECGVKGNMCMLFGQVSVNGDISFEQIARNAIKNVGYDNVDIGMDYKNATVIVAIDKQSPDIAQGVHLNRKEEDIGAGDQGLMMGYATNETQSYMPLTHDLCGKLIRRIEQCRRQKILKWVRPDGKVQVTVQYKLNGEFIKPVRVHTILISCQHDPDVSNEQIRSDLLNKVIKQAVDDKWLQGTRYILNPSGKFIIGGPMGDAGLTGRKIIADTYGGWGGHGGGAFSGKDATKVDRTAAYAARWIAKNLVMNGFCERVLVQISYSIGIASPLSIFVNSYNTVSKEFKDSDLQSIILRNFDLRPGVLINNLKLKNPIFNKLSFGGHFGRNDPDFLWENKIDLSHEYKN